jgi:histidinol-phosphate/aromatic aminotransferase/cobyric acid decarboxylase-like protein
VASRIEEFEEGAPDGEDAALRHPEITEAVLSDETYAEKTRLLVRESRDRIGAAFEQAGYHVVPSQSNFVLVRASDERALLQKLESVGIVARPGSVLSIAGHVRVSAAPLKIIERLEEALSV